MCAVQGKVYLLPVQSVRIQPGRDCLFSGQRHQCGARIGRCPPTGEYKGVTIVLHIQNQAASGFLTRQPTVTNQIVLGYSIFNCRDGIGKHEVRSGNCFDLSHAAGRRQRCRQHSSGEYTEQNCQAASEVFKHERFPHHQAKSGSLRLVPSVRLPGCRRQSDAAG